MTDHHPPHVLTVAIPSIPYGPILVPVREADADYYRAAAKNIRHQKAQSNAFAGSNLTEAVARLCEATAEALDPQSYPHIHRGSEVRPSTERHTMSSTSITIPDHGDQHVTQETQFGVIWPDGTTTWESIDYSGAASQRIYISDLVPSSASPVRRSGYSTTNWDRLIEHRAEQAKLDADQYRDMHRFVKRTVILSVTAAEKVQS